jgi:5-formyltetrahydrofolate cyclo-ligase
VLAAKSALRQEVWGALQRAKTARFPGAAGRIPNFVGAEGAAERLSTTSQWQRANTLKANPDLPQLPVRQRALEDGKRVYMAVPRLASHKPFIVLDPSALTVTARRAASIAGAAKQGRPVGIEEMSTVDLVVAGCVAVSPDGARLGKGGGYSDLEFALGWEAGLIGPSTIVVTTVHDLQVVPDGDIPMTEHDFRLDVIATPTRVIRCSPHRGEGKRGIVWDELTDEKIASIPVLERLRVHRQ